MLFFVLLMPIACFPDFPGDLGAFFSENEAEDYDGDGYTEKDGDCDDLNNKQFPNAVEICDEIDNDCNNEIDDAAIDRVTWYADKDDDGFGAEDEWELVCPADRSEGYVLAKERDGVIVFDCDDNNGNVNPDEHEVCDLLDNDCSGTIDDYEGTNAPRWYLDSDGDGFGDINDMQYQCADENGEGPPSYVSNFDDCDDSHAESHPYVEGMPGGIEVCDQENIDENCNGIANEAAASDASTWYQDADQDGYGNSLIAQTACEQPSGFVLDDTDCDDGRDTVHLGQTEVCDGVDNDCDSMVDEVTAIDVVTYFIDSDGDGYGDPLISQILCPMYQPSNYVIDNTDCDDGDPLQYPQAPEDCNGEDDNCDGSIDEGSGATTPLNTPMWYLDDDGDGFGDVTQSLLQCIEPSGYVLNLNGADCDDENPNIHPDADELCTLTVDENCDGDMTYGVHPSLLPSWYPDSDGDGYGNPSFVIQICQQPQSYVDNADDCNDTDEWVHPEDDFLHVDGAGQFIDHRELCNGKVDLCENDLQGDLTPLDNELDFDGDGYVECTVDVDPLQWENSNQSILGGDDCEDDNIFAYPDAPEQCNGVYEDCLNPDYGSVPHYEMDLDNDKDCDGTDFSLDCDDNDPSVLNYLVDKDCDGDFETVLISTGSYHSCGIDSTGVIQCWGDAVMSYWEDWGDEVDYVSVFPSGVFTEISPDSPCALAEDGSIQCWFLESPHPGTFSQFSVGTNLNHNCGIDSTGSIHCWGMNQFGQSNPPSGLFTQVSVGAAHSCAIDSTGSIHCWGINEGIYDSGQVSNSPLIGSFTDISAGFAHTCALETTGSIQCWGANHWGESSPPAGIFTQIYSGEDHSCAIDNTDAVQCWGRDTDGQVILVPEPGPETPPPGVYTQVSAGLSHSCALDADGFVYCWGGDSYGQVSNAPGYGEWGTGNTSESFTHIVSGRHHNCTLDTSGSIQCWGDDSYGQVSNAPTGAFTQLSLGAIHSCALDNNGSMHCWGKDQPPSGTFVQLSGYCAVDNSAAVQCWGLDNYGQNSPPSGTFTQVSSRSEDHTYGIPQHGSDHACAIDSTESIHCWGIDDGSQGDYGQVSNTPTSGTFTQVTVGPNYSCAIDSTGAIQCWGSDADEQVSNAPTSGTFTDVAAGDTHICAIDTSGAVHCWGNGDFGKTNPPAGTFLQVSPGECHSCAIENTGTVHCWGMGLVGQTTPPADYLSYPF